MLQVLQIQILPTLVIFRFLDTANLMDVERYLNVVLINNFLIIRMLNIFFVNLLTICVSLKKYLFKTFTHFWIALFVLLLSFKSVLYILNINPLIDTWFANLFLLFCELLFHPIDYVLLLCCCYVQKFLILM